LSWTTTGELTGSPGLKSPVLVSD